MVKKLIYLLLIIALISTSLGCQELPKIKGTTTKVDLLKLGHSAERSAKVLKTFTQPEQVESILEAIETAEKIEGILDVVAPDYGLRIYGDHHKIKTYHLWVGKTGGMIMDTENTHTGYKLSEKSARFLYDLIKDK